jgi:hypothetical protein
MTLDVRVRFTRQIPPFKRIDRALTIDLSGKQLLVRSNSFIEFFDYDRGTADVKVR